MPKPISKLSLPAHPVRSMEPPSVSLLRAPRVRIGASAIPSKQSTPAPLARANLSRALCWDLENRPLAYWYDGQTTSEITAFGWRWDGEDDVQTLLLRPGGVYENDRGRTVPYRSAHLLFRQVLCDAGLVYGHNIRRHDLPMLQGQLLRLKLPTLPALTTSDTCRDYPKRKDMSVSLENLAALYGLPGEKLRMAQTDWEQANRLDDDGVAKARERVVSDVVLQAELRRTLLEHGVLGPPRTWRP